jgi:hypothetical protein
LVSWIAYLIFGENDFRSDKVCKVEQGYSKLTGSKHLPDPIVDQCTHREQIILSNQNSVEFNSKTSITPYAGDLVRCNANLGLTKTTKRKKK